MGTSSKETVVRVQLSSQDRTILKNITRAINALTLAMRQEREKSLTEEED